VGRREADAPAVRRVVRGTRRGRPAGGRAPRVAAARTRRVPEPASGVRRRDRGRRRRRGARDRSAAVEPLGPDGSLRGGAPVARGVARGGGRHVTRHPGARVDVAVVPRRPGT
jgi:hypothetical protein